MSEQEWHVPAMNMQVLLQKAKRQTLDLAEVAFAASALKRREGDQILLMNILGVGRAKEFRSLIEERMRHSTDFMEVRIALKTLCDWWDYGEEYLRELLQFLRGDPRDPEHQVRVLACSIGGRLYRKKKFPELFRALRAVFLNQSLPSDVRNVAYWSLAAASGRPDIEIALTRDPTRDEKYQQVMRWISTESP